MVQIKTKEKAMNGPQHFIASERCLAEAIRKHSLLYMDAAMVHATLASAAATAAAFGMGADVGADTERQWYELFKEATEQAAPDTPIYDTMTTPAAEPLVMCGAEDSDASNHGGPCGLPVDHNGPHDNGAGWAWLDDSHYGDGTRIRQEDLAAIEPEHQADEPARVRPYAANL